MALFGSARDISMFRYVNRELLGDIITQQIGYYKYNLDQTRVNMYGENVEGKYYIGPVLLNCLIERNDQAFPTNDFGPDLNWGIKVAFLRDDLVGANVVPEVGDIIMYQEGYFEVDNIISNQQFVGKDPDYPYSVNPLNPGLGNFGYNVSIVCEAHYVPQDKVNITLARG
jgi:hypothetical protein